MVEKKIQNLLNKNKSGSKDLNIRNDMQLHRVSGGIRSMHNTWVDRLHFLLLIEKNVKLEESSR